MCFSAFSWYPRLFSVEHIRISKLNTDFNAASETLSSKVRRMQKIISFYFRIQFVGVKYHIFIGFSYPAYVNPISYTEFASVSGFETQCMLIRKLRNSH